MAQEPFNLEDAYGSPRGFSLEDAYGAPANRGFGLDQAYGKTITAAEAPIPLEARDPSVGHGAIAEGMADIPHPGVAEMSGDFFSAMGRSLAERGRALQQPSAGSRVLSETVKGVASPFLRGDWGEPEQTRTMLRNFYGPGTGDLIYGVVHSIRTGAEAFITRPVEAAIRGLARGIGQAGEETGLGEIGHP